MIEIIEHPGTELIVELRLARPPVNALDTAMLEALAGNIRRESTRAAALVISGASGMFSAGLDVRWLLTVERAAVAGLFTQLWYAQQAIATCAVPTVFALTGHSPAGGTVLFMHGDYRVMARGEFRVGLNEVQVGLFPGTLIHGAFRRLVGGHAAQLLTRGALVDPATALRVGLVDELCEPAEVLSRSLAVARELVALPRRVMLQTRELVRRDLTQLFGEPNQAATQAAEFGEWGASMFTEPETLARLGMLFAKKK